MKDLEQMIMRQSAIEILFATIGLIIGLRKRDEMLLFCRKYDAFYGYEYT